LSAQQTPPIFDGHNDVLTRLLNKQQPNVHQHFIDGDNEGHLDLPRMRSGGFAGGFFAIYVSSLGPPMDLDSLRGETYDVPLPPEISIADALPVVLAQAAILKRIEAASGGGVRICRDANQLRNCIADGTLAVVMHIEGAECIDDDLNSLEVLHAAGLRSLGPVWSRPTRFGHGVPFRFPASPDTGDGLSDLGKRLIHECNRLRIMIDLSHLNEKGFWDVAAISDAPLVATHSNAHALCNNTRNLTDKQLHAIRETDGMVGVNFATAFIRADGQMDENTSLDELLQHVDYLIEQVGESRVGFGSDFDGAMIPTDIHDVTGLDKLRSAMRARGYDDALMARLCYENWLELLQRTW